MKSANGIFCGNFVYSRKPWPHCHQVWCGSCYKGNSSLVFHIELPMNDQGVVLKRKTNRLLVGRNRNYLIQSFQCDLCWFRDLQYRELVEGCRVDERLLGYIKILDLDIL